MIPPAFIEDFFDEKKREKKRKKKRTFRSIYTRGANSAEKYSIAILFFFLPLRLPACA